MQNRHVCGTQRLGVWFVGHVSLSNTAGRSLLIVQMGRFLLFVPDAGFLVFVPVE
jgi:hypothetical protein